MFTAVVTSLVSDVLLPPLSVLLPLNKNLEEKFAVLRGGANHDPDVGYNTLKQAQDDGAVVMAYGYVPHSSILSVAAVELTRSIVSFLIGSLTSRAWASLCTP
jgi:large-conductance mechanosensitive channel